jgi:hypothetical protein
MRIIDLDFNSDRNNSSFLGYSGEHLNTVLNFHVPAELGGNNCVYVINFLKDGENNVESHLALKSRFNSNIVEYYIPNSITGEEASTGTFQLIAYGEVKVDNDNIEYSIIGKSTKFYYVIDKALNTDDTELNITLNAGEEIVFKELLDSLDRLANVQSQIENLDELIGVLEDFSLCTSQYEQSNNRRDTNINDILNGELTSEDKTRYLNLYRIKELAKSLKADISNNAENISNIITKIGNINFNDSFKINNEVPSNIMDAFVKTSEALTSLNNNKINTEKAINYKVETDINNCVTSGVIYRYVKTNTDYESVALPAGNYTIIPSYNGGDSSDLTQYIFSSTGKVYCRHRTFQNSTYIYTMEQFVTRAEFLNLKERVDALTNG